ncbi:Aspartate--tRNA ligase [Sphingomonas paucimobilis]|nr:Aspartate--tRNA ligase [Sphingomonas paucimobilis]
MVAGFDRYFQIAPCFRDEDPRADRLPGEFYQLDLEMSFVTQEEVWETMEPVIGGIFEKFADGRTVTPIGQFPRIPYSESMLKYGNDKPDLRNPLIITDVSAHFTTSGFGLFEKIVGSGGVVRAIPAPGTAEKSRKFFDEMNEWARAEGHAGLGYVTRKGGEFGGPIAKNHGTEGMEAIYAALGLGPDDGLFFAAGKVEAATKLAGLARTRVAEQLGLIEEGAFRLCWIVDFPFYEWDEDEKKVEFAHNPFSMPQGGMEALTSADPLSLKAYQYDLVCNGFEIASGSIRNQSPELMVAAFEKVGLSKADVEERFGGLYRAFQYGRAAARWHGRRCRSHRHADLRCTESARNLAVPDEPARRRPADGCAQPAQRQADARTGTSFDGRAEEGCRSGRCRFGGVIRTTGQ